jgi:hypothetical protein
MSAVVGMVTASALGYVNFSPYEPQFESFLKNTETDPVKKPCFGWPSCCPIEQRDSHPIIFYYAMLGDLACAFGSVVFVMFITEFLSRLRRAKN